VCDEHLYVAVEDDIYEMSNSESNELPKLFSHLYSDYFQWLIFKLLIKIYTHPKITESFVQNICHTITDQFQFSMQY
jgi:hypothetical protein